MKNSIFKITFLILAFLTINIDISNAQTDNSSFEFRVLDPSTSEYFRGNAHIVINHEEQWDFFSDFKKSVKKSKKLTLVIIDQLPKGMFKPNISYKEVWIKKKGQSVKINNVVVKKNFRKGKETHIELIYKSAS